MDQAQFFPTKTFDNSTYLQIPHLPPSFAQCLQYLQFLHALQGVYKSPSSRGFVGYGDADPSNCSSFVHGAEMRIAETRAVNRALRKAYGIGLCSVEELGAVAKQPQSWPSPPASNGGRNGGSSDGQPRLRDQLSLLIRQYGLDSNLVKAYAADFCGTQALSGASRELVESFINHLSACAKQNREALVCKLNSYAKVQEAAS